MASTRRATLLALTLACTPRDQAAADAEAREISAEPVRDPTPRVSEPQRGLEAIAAGVHHTCALADGRVLCWGQHRGGMLGIADDPSDAVTTPQPVVGLERAGTIVQIDADYDSTCALDQKGGVWCWGTNEEGQLGTGDLDPRARPTRVAGPSARSLHVGFRRACMLDKERRAWCWGSGEFGQGELRRVLEPREMPALAGVERLATPEPRCWLKSGAMACWGYNGSGQLGTGEGGCRYDEHRCADCKWLPESTCSHSDAPTAPRELPALLDIAASAHLSYALDHEGGVWTWGQVGVITVEPDEPNSSSPTYAPRRMSELGPMLDIDAGASHACTLDREGGVYCWGNDSFGQLGYEAPRWESEQATPRRVEGLPPARQLALGFYFTCVLTGEGEGTQAWCWGDNGSGQLGDGTTERRHVPALVRMREP